MKGKKYFQALSFLCVISLATGIASNMKPPVNIDNISIQPGIQSTKIVLESASLLTILNSYYSKEFPSTLVVDLANTNAGLTPKISSNTTSIVEDIKLEEGDSNNLRLMLELKDKVPYRIYTDQKMTFIELNQFQKAGSNYILEPDIKKVLDNQATSPMYLKNIGVSETPSGIDITASLTGTAVPHVFVLKNPLRLIVDLHNTLYSRQASNYPVHKLGIDKVRTAQFQVSNPYTITRMVFDLNEPKLYSLKSDNNELTISFYKELKTAPKPIVSTPLPAEAPIEIISKKFEPAAEKPAPPIITETVKDKSLETETKTETALPKENPPPVAATSPGSEETVTNKDIGLAKDKEAEVKTSETLNPQETQFTTRTLTREGTEYIGEKMNLRFIDAELRDVIFTIAETANLNVTFDPGVQGTVNVNWIDVPWDQALDLILKQQKMGQIIDGNVLRIAPLDVLTREQQEQRRFSESQEMAGPLQTKVIPLSYSKVSDVKGLLQSRISSRGEIIIDERTNKMIISEVEERMELLLRLIDEVDTATPQVSIEARIVEASSTFVRNLGVQWGWRSIADPFYGNQTSLQFPNKINVDGALIPQSVITKGIGGPLGGYAVNLPAPAFATAVGLSMSNVLDTFTLDMAITAIETSGTGKIISAPKITTQNNKEAEIIQGRQIPVQTVANFTVTTRFQNAALELRARPQITAEGTIIMDIDLVNNAPDFAHLVNGIPPIITQSASVTVMIPDGGTTVIGGIYRTEDSVTRDRIPFFHKIPILGNLFKSFSRTKENRELLIFITPRIIK